MKETPEMTRTVSWNPPTAAFAIWEAIWGGRDENEELGQVCPKSFMMEVAWIGVPLREPCLRMVSS